MVARMLVLLLISEMKTEKRLRLFAKADEISDLKRLRRGTAAHPQGNAATRHHIQGQKAIWRFLI